MMTRLTRLAAGSAANALPYSSDGQTIAAIDHRRAYGREMRQRAVLAIDAELIGAVRARVLPHRPHDVRDVRVVGKPLVAAARS